jgi:hypothetical protein
MTKATKNISSAAKHTKTQNRKPSTNTSNAARKKDTAPAATDTVSDKIQEHFKSLNPYKFMNNSDFMQLVGKQSELAQKALLLQECGIINSVDIKTDVSNGSFDVAVIINHYASDQREWRASKLNYGDDKEVHENLDAYNELLQFVDAEIEKLNQRSQSIVARIANLLSIFKK